MLDYSIFGLSNEELNKIRASRIYSISERVSTFFWNTDDRPGFEEREGQQDMALEILDALKRNQHILVEAGVGIGKSYAYLVPLLLYNQAYRKPIVIATSTIALQEQLMGDIDYLKRQLRVSQNVIFVKGQTNYLCVKRTEEYLNNKNADMAEELSELLSKKCQDRADIKVSIPPHIWDQICVRYGRGRRTCHHRCQYRDTRVLIRYTSEIVLCNQDFLTVHLLKEDRLNEGLLNPGTEVIVVDEAHNLENKVRSVTTERINQSSLEKMIEEALYDVGSDARPQVESYVQAAAKATSNFFQYLRGQVQRQITESPQNMKYADRFFFKKEDPKAISLLKQMTGTAKDLSEEIQLLALFGVRSSSTTIGPDGFHEWADRLTDVVETLDDYLLWIEKRGNLIEFVHCPRNTKEIISRLYFGGSARTILTSATLTNSSTGSLQEQYS